MVWKSKRLNIKTAGKVSCGPASVACQGAVRRLGTKETLCMSFSNGRNCARWRFLTFGRAVYKLIIAYRFLE
jgi:hypothetical protein